MIDHEPDLELLTRLRAADPASSLPAADPDRVSELLGVLRSDTVRERTSRAPESRETGTHDRSPLTWLVAAAAVLLIAAAGAFGLAQHRDDSRPVAQPSGVTRLGYVPVEGRCLLPSTGVLRVQTLAFRGTLVSLVDGTASFDVTRWYVTNPGVRAKVEVSSARLADLVQAARLQVGQVYLVAAHGNDVTACGISGPVTPARQALYTRAYG